jgi:hypothetical protein
MTMVLLCNPVERRPDRSRLAIAMKIVLLSVE